jgi:hypothetical protein
LVEAESVARGVSSGVAGESVWMKSAILVRVVAHPRVDVVGIFVLRLGFATDVVGVFGEYVVHVVCAVRGHVVAGGDKGGMGTESAGRSR